METATENATPKAPRMEIRFELRQGVGYSGKLGGKAYVARLTGLSDRYGFDREFLNADSVERDHFNRRRYIRTLTYVVSEPGLYEVQAEGDRAVRLVWRDSRKNNDLCWFVIDADRAARILRGMTEGMEFDAARKASREAK